MREFTSLFQGTQFFKTSPDKPPSVVTILTSTDPYSTLVSKSLHLVVDIENTYFTSLGICFSIDYGMKNKLPWHNLNLAFSLEIDIPVHPSHTKLALSRDFFLQGDTKFLTVTKSHIH